MQLIWRWGLVFVVGCGATTNARLEPTPSVIVELAADGYLSLARASDGSVYAWGRVGGQIEPTPVQLEVSDAFDVDVGNDNWCALTADGAHCGFETGIGLVRLPEGDLPRVVDASGLLLGSRSGVRFSDSGCLMGRGCLDLRGDTDPGPHHAQWPLPTLPPIEATRVVDCYFVPLQGGAHAWVGLLTDDGHVFCLGTSYEWFESIDRYRVISAPGAFQACMVELDGTATCFEHSVLDHIDREYPLPVTDVVDVVSMFAYGPWEEGSVPIPGGCALRSDQTVWCWGSNRCDEPPSVGVAPVPNDCEPEIWTEPRLIPLAAPAEQIVAGGWQVCALLADHSVWCWGSNRYGELGDGTRVDSVTPVRVGLP